MDLVKSYDFAAAIQALRRERWSDMPPSLPGSESTANTPGIPFDNTLLILGAESATFYQRVPVPIGMWQPFGNDGVPLRLNAPGVVRIDGQRVAVLICYEQILTYPILASMLQHPTVLVGISNTFWFADTPIPRYQANARARVGKLVSAFHICWPSTLDLTESTECRSHFPTFPDTSPEYMQLSLFSEVTDATPVDNLEDGVHQCKQRTT